MEENKAWATQEIDIIDYLRVFVRYRILLLIVIVFVTSLSVVYTLSLPALYTSQASAILPKSSSAESALGNLSGLASFAGLPLASSGSDKDIIEAVCASIRMRDDVINEFSLVETNNQKKRIAERASLSKKVKVIISKAGIMTISVTAKSPTLACNIVTYYFDNLENLNNEIKWSSSRPVVQLFDKPEVPIKKSAPSNRKNVMIGFMLSVVIGVVFVLLIEFVKQIKVRMLNGN